MCDFCLNNGLLTLDCQCQCRAYYLELQITGYSYNKNRNTSHIQCAICGHYVHIWYSKNQEIRIIDNANTENKPISQ